MQKEPISPDGFCKRICLKGRVQVVSNLADFKVMEVSQYPDLNVKKVSGGSSASLKVGEWFFVDHNPDFTIQFVKENPDFTIKYVDKFPGCS